MSAAVPSPTDAATFIQLLMAFGIGGTALKLAELAFRKFTGRKGEQITDAQRLTAMSLNLVAPVHAELVAARLEASNLRRELEEFRDAFEEWARAVKRQLEDNGLTPPPMPEMRGTT